MLAFASVLPRQASLHGEVVDGYLRFNLWLVIGLAALAHALLLAGLWWRRSRDAGAGGRRRTRRIEVLPLLAATVLFAGLAVRAERLWAVSRYVGASPEALQVEVVGMQFVWQFRYPGVDGTFGRTAPRLVDAGAGNPLGIDPADRHGADDVVSSELVLPAGREVDLAIRSLDVMHGFALPEMRLKQNAVPGETVHVHFTPKTPGTYAVMCTQVCGLGHYRMSANLRVLPAAEFAEWMAGRERSVAR